MRRMRRDGNCFYRGLLFSLYEQCSKSAPHLQQLQSIFEQSRERLICIYSDIVVEPFYDQVIDELAFISSLSLLSSSEDVQKEIETRFEDEITFLSLITYLRLMVSLTMREKESHFSPFVENFFNFLKEEVESMNKEADEQHIVALVSTFNIRVCVCYLDGNEGKLNEHIFDPNPDLKIFDFHQDSRLSINFLYRPGHYDLCYA